MRTYLLLFFTMFLVSAAMAQTEKFEDFESYNVGDGIAASSPDFVLWPAAAARDATVSDDRAKSGTKSLFLPGGQGVDVLYNLGQQYTSGSFVYSMDVFIPAGRNTYFNFQGSDAVGTQGNWVLQCYLKANGIFEVDNSGPPIFSNNYNQDQWVNIKLDVNLDENLWRMFIDDECLGSFVQRLDGNSIYSVDLYPDDNNSLAYVDNVSFTHTPDSEDVLIDNDATFGFLDLDSGIGVLQSEFFGIDGTSQNIGLGIINQGENDITSVSASLEVGGTSINKDLTVNIAPGTGTLVDFFDGPIPFTNSEQIGSFAINSVNGIKDDNTCNDKGPVVFTGFTPTPGKAVLAEESTGVRCPWCPAGAVFMDYMSDKYGDLFVGVASHDSDQGPDPMTNVDWNIGMAPLTSNPSYWINRDTSKMGGFGSTSNIETHFVDLITQNVLVTLSNTAEYDGDTRELKVTVFTEFPVAPLTSGKLLLGLTEDDVNNADSAYDQTNNYGGGGQGPMGGYEDRPNLIPGAEMYYNHVMRLALTPATGLTGAYANATAAGTEHEFVTILPEDWDVRNMNVVSAYVDADNGQILNAAGTAIDQFVSNDEVDPYLDGAISVSPNPTTGLANIALNFETATPVELTVADAMGKVISRKDYGLVSPNTSVSIDVSEYQVGNYYLHFRSENKIAVKRLIVIK